MAKTFYLTIDDGPCDDFIARLEALESRAIKAIWYCLGSQLEIHGDKAIEAIKLGHVIGNHGYDHQTFSDLSLEACYEQINRTDQIINKLYEDAGIERPYKTFRFPYLDMGDGAIEVSFHNNNPRVSAINRYLMSQGYRQADFKGQGPKPYAERFLDMCIGISTTFDTRDWSLDHKDQSGHLVDENYLIDVTIRNLDELSQSDGYEIVLTHSFVPLKTSIKLIDLILAAGYKFDIPKKAMKAGLKPLMRYDDHHMTKHHWSKTHLEKKDTEIVFIGDSLTRRWEDYNELVNKYFEAYKCANYGIGGDTINNLIWRLQDGLLDHMSPKVVILLIGTNNLASYIDEEIIDGIRYIISLIKDQCPKASLIVNGIFPRNRDHLAIDYNKRIMNINSQLLEKLDPSTTYFDMTDDFLGGKSQVSKDIMPDGLHINEDGYHMWGKALKAMIKKVMVN